MVNFAELKAKAEKAKDASVTKLSNTRDRFSSAPSSQINWDPNWKRAPPPAPGVSASGSTTSRPPPPPARGRPDVIASPMVPRASWPTEGDAPTPPFTPPPPPTRVASGYPPSHRSTSSLDSSTKIDWAHLSAEDKQAFFGWLDEFFSRYLGIEVTGRAPSSSSMQSTRVPVSTCCRFMFGSGQGRDEINVI
ncbi:hypothetical protein V8E55_009652 [Tylopilus felleus]